MPIVAVSMSESHLHTLENLQKQGGFSNRSEAIRHAIQSLMAEHEDLEQETGEVTIVLTAVYSDKGKNNRCSRVQHEYSHMISSMMHSHSNRGECVEVMVLKGDAEEARKFIKKIRSQNRVVHVQISVVGR
ncbi:MAG: CopG family ribbon-helix-helix protein [Candidatus Thorarchaeota archaeon]